MDPVIKFRGRQIVDFRQYAFADPADHGFRWVDVKRYELGAAHPTDEAVLRALIAEDHFRDDYAGGGADTQGAVHGPFQLGHITVEAYEGIDATSAAGVVDAWARQYGAVPAELTEALGEQVYNLISKASSCYRLKELDEAAFHDWAGVHTHFHEFVAIDRGAGTVALIVAADD